MTRKGELNTFGKSKEGSKGKRLFLINRNLMFEAGGKFPGRSRRREGRIMLVKMRSLHWKSSGILELLALG
jgi:hypothetical protein